MRRHLIHSASVLSLIAATPAASLAAGLPSGGTVQSGAVNITQTSPSQMTITQTSKTGVINWNDFSIGKGQTVQFLNGNGATLNRVLGASPSRIDGALTATGSVYLMNGYGVIIGRTGSINVGQSFIATSLGLSDKAFTDGGDLTFTGGSGGAITNLGSILAAGGDVVLAGPNVANSGTINAPQGDVGLLGGSTILLRSNLGDKGKFVVWGGAQGVAVTHDGEISAAEVELRSDLGDIRAGAVGRGGNITATGVSAVDGKIFLVAQQGTLTAHDELKATKSDGSGGFVETSGEHVDFSGVAVKAGNWLIDPTDLVVNEQNAGGISIALNQGATVTLSTRTCVPGDAGCTSPLPDSPKATGTNGAVINVDSGVGVDGNIDINAPLSWAAGKLVINANGNITVSAKLDISGAGKIDIYPGRGNSFGFSVKNGIFIGSLTVHNDSNGDVVKYDGAFLNPISKYSDFIGKTSGNYYLTQDIENKDGTILSPIGTLNAPFKGNFEGMGHSISGLIVSGSDNVGLFGYVENLQNIYIPHNYLTSLFRNFSISGDVKGAQKVGIVAGHFEGEIANVIVSGTATGTDYVGGVVGELISSPTSPSTECCNHGEIIGTTSSATVSGSNYVGGLVGDALGANYSPNLIVGIESSSSSGKVSGQTYVGGLVGALGNFGVVDFSSATGDVSGGEDVGGLVGYSLLSSIQKSKATGAVTGGSKVGGLVGLASISKIEDNISTGSVSGYKIIGGLIGDYEGSYQAGLRSIERNTSMGTVSGVDFVGGFVGSEVLAAIFFENYSTGTVITNGNAAHVGGFFGQLDVCYCQNNYWNTETSGRMTDNGGATGLTTSQLQSGLPTGFSSAWATGPGLYPYLTALFTNPAAVSGFTYSSLGVKLAPTVANPASVTVYARGGALGTASVGADGSYYLLLNGTTLNSATPIGGILSTASPASLDGLSYIENPNVVGGSVTGFNLTSGVYSFKTSAARYSALWGSNLPAAFGAANLTAPAAALPGKWIDLVANQGFTVDQPITLTSGDISLTTLEGPLTLTSAVTVAPSNTISLNSAGAINASGAAISAGRLTGSSVGGASFNNPANAIGSLATFTNTGSGPFVVADAQNLTLSGTVDTGAASGVFTSPGSITLGPGATVSSSAGGTALSLESGGAFINYSGQAAFSTPNGRWLIYSSAPANDTFNGLNSNANPVWNTAAGGPVTVAGNRYVFAYQPTPVITTLNDTKVYGNDATAQIQADYAISVQPGVAGAYLADTPTMALSGAPVISSSGAAVHASVAGGPYGISAAPGSLVPLDGYGAPAFVNTGALAVTQRPITISLVGSITKSSDGSPSVNLANANYSVSGLVSGDAATLALPANGALDTTVAGSGKSITVNGITLTGPDSGNYTFPVTVAAPIGTVYSPDANPPLPRPNPPNLISISDQMTGNELQTATDERNADVPARASMRSKSERAAQYDLTADNDKQKKARRHPATETGNGDLQYSGGGPQ